MLRTGGMTGRAKRRVRRSPDIAPERRSANAAQGFQTRVLANMLALDGSDEGEVGGVFERDGNAGAFGGRRPDD